jgi:triosephosphate isomerase
MGKRKPVVIANWKMNKVLQEAADFANDIKNKIPDESEIEVGIAAQDLFLTTIAQAVGDSSLKVVAQNSHWQDEGAFTGETSPKALKDIGVDYSMLGHFERRQYFNENDQYVSKKAQAALRNDLGVIVDIEEIEQLMPALKSISAEQMNNVIIAFEPTFAIGSGKPASEAGAQEVAKRIRELLSFLYDEQVAEQTRILYGGSVNQENAAVFVGQKDIDGVLVGTASLDETEFLKIVEIVHQSV